MKVVVLGSGVIGVASAYYLAKLGHQVSVIERRAGAGLETSFANGGQIAAGHTAPWASPDAPMQMLKWLGREDAPLIFRLKADPRMWAWGLRFLANCRRSRFRRGTLRSFRLAAYSRESLGELRRDTGIAYDERCEGILHIYRDRKAFEAAARDAGLLHAHGGHEQVVDPQECLTIEPALEATRAPIAGGIFYRDDESGDAHKFTQSLARLCANEGVEFRYETTVESLVARGDRIESAATDRGLVGGDAFVLAMGADTPRLVRRLGMKMPIYPVKGYSVTLPVNGHNRAPTVSITDESRKIVVSRLGERLRAAGTAEIAGYDLSLNPLRARSILEVALELFPDGGDAEQAEYWTGLRPMTPDGPPIIGPTPYRNLYVNAGHGTLGWTMACGSGRVLADLVSGKEPAIDLTGLTLERF